MATQLLRAIVDGILGGGVYALMAVGLTLIFGVLDIINIAQGILVVLAAYLSYVLSVHLHIDLFLGLLVTVTLEGVLYTIFGPNTVQLNAWYVTKGVKILGGPEPYYLPYIYLLGFGL